VRFGSIDTVPGNGKTAKVRRDGKRKNKTNDTQKKGMATARKLRQSLIVDGPGGRNGKMPAGLPNVNSRFG
jgi:hypothetical protein